MGIVRMLKKAKGMEKEGAIGLLKYHQGLQELKIKRLEGQLAQTKDEREAIVKEKERREKESEK